MAIVIRDKWDIGTTAIKGQLVGAQIQLADGSWKTVASDDDWYIDFATQMINIHFAEDVGLPASSFRISDKFIVKLDDSITPIKEKKTAEPKR